MPGLVSLHRTVMATVFFIALAPGLRADDTVPTDAGGRPLLDPDGKWLVYPDAPQSDAAVSEQPAAPEMTTVARLAVAAPEPAVNPAWSQTWRTRIWGAGIGVSGILPVDVDGDGKTEFVLGGGSGYGGNRFWSIAAYDAGTAQYELRWQSSEYANGVTITALELGPSPTRGHRNLWVGRSDGMVDVFDLQTRSRLATLNIGAPVRDLEYGNADNRGESEMVVLTSARLQLYRPYTFALYRTADHGGDSMAIGDVAGDALLEVVLNTGKVLRLEAGNTEVVWNRGQNFGARIALGNLDDDAHLELVSAESWYYLRAWDLEITSPIWEVSTSQNIDSLLVQNVVGNSQAEILYGDGQWGSVHVLRANGIQFKSLRNPEHGVSRIAAFDADNDGQLELVWGAGWTSSGADYLYVHDFATTAREWTSVDESAPFQAVDMADVDNDGEEEIVVASWESDSGYSDGLVSVYDAATGALEWRSTGRTFGGNAWTGVHDLRIANVDADAQAEILVTTDRLYDGALYVIDGLSHAVQRTVVLDAGAPLYAMDIADVDRDGALDVVAGAGREHTGSPGTYLYVINPRTGATIWHSVSLTTGWSDTSDVQVATLGSGTPSLIAVNGRVNRIRWTDRQHLQSLASDYLAVAVMDLTPDAGKEILAGSQNGRLDVLSGTSLAELDSHQVCNGEIRALLPVGPTRVAMACGSELLIHDTGTWRNIATVPVGIPGLGAGGSLRNRPVDGNRQLLMGGAAASRWTKTPASVTSAQ